MRKEIRKKMAQAMIEERKRQDLALRDRELIARLQAFQECHRSTTGPFQPCDAFDLLITYLRGDAEAMYLPQLCRVIHQLRLMNVTIGTSVLHANKMGIRVRSWLPGTCPFTDCTHCRDNPIRGRIPSMSWMFETEARLVHQLIKMIHQEPLHHVGPKNITRVLTGLPMEEHENSLASYDFDTFIAKILDDRDNFMESKRCYTSNLFKVTINTGIVTDIWHRDDTIGTRIISPHYDLFADYSCPTTWWDFKHNVGINVFVPISPYNRLISQDRVDRSVSDDDGDRQVESVLQDVKIDNRC